MKKIFITGVDTGVGKTYVGTILVKALLRSGYNCIPRKPIETGCTVRENEFVPEDATLYYQASQEKIPLNEICPYRYEPPISPERAIRLANDNVTVKDLVATCSSTIEPDYLIVEGAGGFYSPLCIDGLNADLAQELTSHVILISKDRLGCLNQTLLTIEAIKNRKLNLLAIVLNQYREHEASAMDNYEDLCRRLDVPIITIPNMIDADQKMLDSQYNSIEKLLEIITTY